MHNEKRIFEAADVVLSAIASDGEQASIVVAIGVDELEDTLPPGLFTEREYSEAFSMLVRMGFIDCRYS